MMPLRGGTGLEYLHSLPEGSGTVYITLTCAPNDVLVSISVGLFAFLFLLMD
jgi:hypothetical protein